MIRKIHDTGRRQGRSPELQVRLAAQLYAMGTVREAARRYERVANTRIEKQGKSIRVVFNAVDPEVLPILKDEFCNMVLALEKERRCEG